MNGVFLKEGETVERVDTETGQKALDQLEDERAFDAADVDARTSQSLIKQLFARVLAFAITRKCARRGAKVHTGKQPTAYVVDPAPALGCFLRLCNPPPYTKSGLHPIVSLGRLA